MTLARDLGTLIARLQATPAFSELHEYPAVLARMLGYLRGSGAFAVGLLDPHLEAFERIRAAYPWQTNPRTSSHNDPNPNNILFDGERLWLIDWETAYRNEPMIDLAILADNFARTFALADALLRGWSGQAPVPSLHARLTLLRPLTRLYYACLIFAVAARSGVESHADLSAPTSDEFRAALADGRLTPGAPDMMRTLSKMLLAGFLSGSSGPDFEKALAIVRAG
jgi:Ser/Thr protein kinase RdoA (MazF antagonist)